MMAGQKAVEEVASSDGIDTVVAAMVGFAGLRSTAAAVAAGRRWRWQTRRPRLLPER